MLVVGQQVLVEQWPVVAALLLQRRGSSCSISCQCTVVVQLLVASIGCSRSLHVFVAAVWTCSLTAVLVSLPCAFACRAWRYDPKECQAYYLFVSVLLLLLLPYY